MVEETSNGVAKSGTSHAPRLVIQEMILENFKSYAGEQRVGPFHKSFSSVVGPNGSGKSNVIDAMLFVFGKRAKQLRLNKVSELIHNSTNHRGLEMARVSVHFCEIVDGEGESFEVVPNSELVVSRTAHRNNTSNYYLNGKKSNFTEVTDVLKKKGIDLDNNRFLILQGEVEQISMMKPKGQTEHETGLLEYLEDIIGTDRYIQGIEEGGKALEALNEARQSMVNRLKIAERERDGLESEKLAAEAYLEKQRECLEAKRLLAEMFVLDASRNVCKIEENIACLEEKLAKEKEKCKEFTSELGVFESQYEEANKELVGIQKELEDATMEFKEFERKDIQYREDIKHLKIKLKKAEDKAAKDVKKAEQAESDAQHIAFEIPNLERRAAEATKQLEPAEKKMEEMIAGTQGESEELLRDLRRVRADLAPWEKKITNVKSRIDVAQSELDMLAKSKEAAVLQYEKARTSLQEAKETAKSKALYAREMASNVEDMKKQVTAAIDNEKKAIEESRQMEEMAREARGRAEQKKADASQRATHSAAMTALLKARDTKAIPGIRGRLGDLGAIDAMYDVAVSTACPALDYVVVDTTSAAQRCVELLRSNKLGVATFLILEKQAHLKKFLTEQFQAPEGAPRLFDLVKCNNADIRLAFYFALRDTLVAQNLEQASKIAYSGNSRWRRVVTQKGEMINENGTMSGGGAKPRGGRMCLGEQATESIIDPNQAAREAKKAEMELEELVNKVKQARANVSEAASKVKAAKIGLSDIETSITKAKMEAEAAANLSSDLEARISGLQAATQASQEDIDRMHALEKEIEDDKKELVDLEQSSDNLRKKAKKLEIAIENVGGEPLKKQRELVSRLQNEISSAESEAAKKQAQIKTAQKQAEKLKKDAFKAEEDAKMLIEKQEAAMVEFKTLEEEAFKVIEAMNAKQMVIQEKEKDVLVLKRKFEEKQKEVSVIRQVEVDIANEIDVQQGTLKEESGKQKHWRRESEALYVKLQELMENDPAQLDENSIAQANTEELQYRIAMLEEEIERMDVNPEAINAWKKADEEYSTRAAELETATLERDAARVSFEDLKKKRLEEFMAGFNTISLKLKEMYQMITMGGDAELELVDSLDPFSEGILFSVRPPKKSWKNIANLSGGEKTLSSLSLVFALHHFKPTPLYVMDEIDAALDFKNVSIVGNYIKERTKNAQFVIISLRNNMFELADRLVGIYKTDNATKSVALNPGNFKVGSIPVNSSENQPPAISVQ